VNLHRDYDQCSPQVAVFCTPLHHPITKCRCCRPALHGTRPVDTQVRVALSRRDHFGAPSSFCSRRQAKHMTPHKTLSVRYNTRHFGKRTKRCIMPITIALDGSKYLPVAGTSDDCGTTQTCPSLLSTDTPRLTK